MASRRSSKAKGSNGWDALSGILIASMNKGQFPVAGILLLLIVMIWRMPPESVAKLAFTLEDHVANGSLAGYILSVLLALGWFFHARWQRKIIADEMQRVGEEKSKLQETAMQIPIESSQQ